MVRLGLSAALTPYPATRQHHQRDRAPDDAAPLIPFLPFFPFAKPLPLLDIPDPRCSGLAATRGYAAVPRKVP